MNEVSNLRIIGRISGHHKKAVSLSKRSPQTTRVSRQSSEPKLTQQSKKTLQMHYHLLDTKSGIETKEDRIPRSLSTIRRSSKRHLLELRNDLEYGAFTTTRQLSGLALISEKPLTGNFINESL